MKDEKKISKKLDYKKIAIVVAVLVFLIFIIVLIFKQSTKDSELKLNDFEKIAVYNYLEDNLLDISTLYKLSGKSDYNELEVFQSKLKQALDTYFSTHSESEVSTSTVLGLVDSKYIPSGIDFHGIIVSDYEYNPENETFRKSPGANANIAGIESEVNSIDYSGKKASVQKIEKTKDNKCKVTFNIVNSIIGNDSVEATGEAILSIQDNDLKIDSCTIND